MTKSGSRGIIHSENNLVLSTFVNSNDKLSEYSKRITPIPGYEDIIIHGNRSGFTIKDLDGKESTNYTPWQFAEILRETPSYHGGAIRLISCETGAGDTCAAQMLANQLGVDVLAPSDIVIIDSDGNISVGKRNNGTWILFKPKGG